MSNDPIRPGSDLLVLICPVHMGVWGTIEMVIT